MSGESGPDGSSGTAEGLCDLFLCHAAGEHAEELFAAAEVRVFIPVFHCRSSGFVFLGSSMMTGSPGIWVRVRNCGSSSAGRFFLRSVRLMRSTESMRLPAAFFASL